MWHIIKVAPLPLFLPIGIRKIDAKLSMTMGDISLHWSALGNLFKMSGS